MIKDDEPKKDSSLRGTGKLISTDVVLLQWRQRKNGDSVHPATPPANEDDPDPAA